MKLRKNALIIALVALSTTAALHAASTLHYRISDAGSEAVARVAFMGVASKTARFDTISGDVSFSPANLKAIDVDVSIDASKLSASDRTTEKELKAKNFFWIERYPTLRFTASGLSMENSTQGILTGNLTVRGVTKPCTMVVTFSRPPSKANGQDQLSLTATTVINRQAFGMTAYSAFVGKKVNITIRAVLKGT